MLKAATSHVGVRDEDGMAVWKIDDAPDRRSEDRNRGRRSSGRKVAARGSNEHGARPDHMQEYATTDCG